MNELTIPSEFPVIEVDTGKGLELVALLRKNLLELKDARTSGVEMDAKAIHNYAIWLLYHQHRGIWCTFLVGEMPADARTDFIKMPTCIALATLIYIRRNYPEIADKIQACRFHRYNLKKAIEDSYHYLSRIKFLGHGYDRYREMIEFLAALHDSDAIQEVFENPEIYKEAHGRLSHIKAELIKALGYELSRDADESDETDWSSLNEDEIRRGLTYLGRDKPILSEGQSQGGNADPNQEGFPF